MRRNEFDIRDQFEIQEFLKEMGFGFLATIGEDGWPRIKPLNFVYHNQAIYFHGSKIGEKMKDLDQENRVTFSVAKEYSMIPSYVLDPKLACPATVFFKSVTIRGRAYIVDDLEEKVEAFTAFMEKLQQEGGYEPFDLADKKYLANLKGVALIKIEIEDMTAKFKLGQNLKESQFQKVITGLENRDSATDQETIELMKKHYPHPR